MTNTKKPHIHAEVIKAWADGAKIQYESSAGEWRDIAHNNPMWEQHTKYRVKPEPVVKYHGIMQGLGSFQDFNHNTGYHMLESHVRSNDVDKWKVIAVVKTTFVDGVPVATEILK